MDKEIHFSLSMAVNICKFVKVTLVELPSFHELIFSEILREFEKFLIQKIPMEMINIYK